MTVFSHRRTKDQRSYMKVSSETTGMTRNMTTADQSSRNLPLAVENFRVLSTLVVFDKSLLMSMKFSSRV